MAKRSANGLQHSTQHSADLLSKRQKVSSVTAPFVLGPDLSCSAHSFEAENAPTVRPSSHRLYSLTANSGNSPSARRPSSQSTCSINDSSTARFSQIRNRSYSLSGSSQQQPPVTRSSSNTNKRSTVTSPQKSSKGQSQPARKAKLPKKSKSSTRVVSDKSTVKTTSISSADEAKWAPVQEEARLLVLECVALSKNFLGVASSKRNEFNQLMDSMERKLRKELTTAVAPKTGRLKSYSNLSSYEKSLQIEFLALVDYSKQLHEKLESVQSQAKDRLKEVEGVARVPLPDQVHSIEKDWSLESKEIFCEYLTDLIECDRYRLIELDLNSDD